MENEKFDECIALMEVCQVAQNFAHSCIVFIHEDCIMYKIFNYLYMIDKSRIPALYDKKVKNH